MRLAQSALTIAATALAMAASAQDHVLERLESSPRHHEWVDMPSGDRSVHCFVAFPEVSGEATAVLVIHENKGLTDWVRSVADQLAEHGHIAIAPDLLSGAGPGGGNTDAFDSLDAATQAIYALDQEQVTADLNAVADHVAALPACNGSLAVAGFCWGGGQTFRFATNREGLAAAFVFYGATELSDEDLGRIACPVYGFYGGNDARINATIPDSTERMAALGKTFEPVTYDGAGHGFMRAGEGPEASEENRRAMEAGWERWLALLGGL
jgi:carboxymethylenebutenolidase